MIATYHPTPAAQGAFRKISRPPSLPFSAALVSWPCHETVSSIARRATENALAKHGGIFR